MLKKGILCREDLRNPAKKGRPISYELLRIGGGDAREEVEGFEAVIREVRLDNGVYRTTYRHRFAELDLAVTDVLAECFDPTHNIRVYDLGASDCLTTTEWARNLFARFPACTVTASDIVLNLVEFGATPSERFICEPGGALLQYIRPPYVIPLNPRWSRGDYFNLACQKWATWRFRRLVPADWQVRVTAKPRACGVCEVYPLSLIHPEALSLRDRDPRFHITQHSLFDPFPAPCDVLRTMNVLNLSYFDRSTLELAFHNLWSAVKTGGVWIVGKTCEATAGGITRATLYRKGDRGWHEIISVNGGTELREIIRDRRLREMRERA